MKANTQLGKGAAKSLLVNQIFEVIETFEEPDKTILIMRYSDDLDPKEIADLMNVSANNISVRLHRAHERLRKIFNLF